MKWISHKRIIIAFVVAAGLLAIAVSVLQSEWLAAFLKARIITAIEHGTGGRAEIGEVHFDWLRRRIDLRGVTIHGTEASSVPPLLNVGYTRIELSPFLSVGSVIADRPAIHLYIDDEGRTNIPAQRVAGKIKVDMVELADADAWINLHRWQMSILGRGLAADTHGQHFAFSADKLSVSSPHFATLEGGAKLSGSFSQRSANIRTLAVSLGSSVVTASGTIEDFNNPHVVLSMDAHIAGQDLKRFPQLSFLRSGDFGLHGAVAVDSGSPRFRGELDSRSLVVASSYGDIAASSLQSNFSISRSGAELSDLRAHVWGGSVTGTLAASRSGRLSFSGALSSVPLPHAVLFAFRRQIPWTGALSGTLQAAAQFPDIRRTVDARWNFTVSPYGREPVQGSIRGSYRPGSIIIEESRLRTPESELECSGNVGGKLAVNLNTANIAHLVSFAGLSRGAVTFAGDISNVLAVPEISGDVTVQNAALRDFRIDDLRGHVSLSSAQLQLRSASVVSGPLHLSIEGFATLVDWKLEPHAAFAARGTFSGANLRTLARQAVHRDMPIINTVANGSLSLHGTPAEPEGTATVALDSLDAFGARLNRMHAQLTFDGDIVRIENGRVETTAASLIFSGAYTRIRNAWLTGHLRIRADSSGFPLSNLSPVRALAPQLQGTVRVHGESVWRVDDGRVEPEGADGQIALTQVTAAGEQLGAFDLGFKTAGNRLTGSIRGWGPSGAVQGVMQAETRPEVPVRAKMQFTNVKLQAASALIPAIARLSVSGSVDASADLSGELSNPEKLAGTVQFSHLQVAPERLSPAVSFSSAEPVIVTFASGAARVANLRLKTKDAEFTLSGLFRYLAPAALDMHVAGKVDLRILELFDPSLTSAGTGDIDAQISGAVAHPSTAGSLHISDGSLRLASFENELTHVSGNVRFEGDHAVIQELAGATGGGRVGINGTVTFADPDPIYNLHARVQSVRFRYANAVSANADASLQMTGTVPNAVVFGSVLLHRVSIDPTADIAAVIGLASGAVPAGDLSAGRASAVHLDVHILSEPGMPVNAASSRDIQAQVDLRLRGTPSHPALLGNLAANEGQITVFGAKYRINRANVTFNNPARIEPIVDADLQTQARGITVDIIISGSVNRLNMNYRSDPPLQPKDIIALLTVGRPPGFVPTQPTPQPSNNDVAALQSGANSVLGGAGSPQSGRLSKLFGITNIKIDPMVQGVTTTPQDRLTIEQQISRNVTITYVTNLAQTSEQIFRFEWALNPQYSVVAVRDDNGEFGIDIQYKKRFH